MYIPKPFEVTDAQEVHSFIEKNSFGQLISQVNGRLFSTHLPFLCADDLSVLSGHLAKQNPQVNFIEGQEVMVTLEGPHDYISPSWYDSAGVPTWNYQTVHIYGHCEMFDDDIRLSKLLETLTDKYELNLPNPWLPDYKPAMLSAIVGFEMTITDIQCKFKLSQNRSIRDQQQVVDELTLGGSKKLAQAMQIQLVKKAK